MKSREFSDNRCVILIYIYCVWSDEERILWFGYDKDKVLSAARTEQNQERMFC
jgi:hypothetical protein